MMPLARKIQETRVKAGEIALFYLAQAGFLIKTPDEKKIVIDAYLSDAAERLFGFRRMIPALIKAEDLDADLFISTHEHVDHLDPDTLKIVARNPKTRFVGAPDCESYYRELGIEESRFFILKEGEQFSEDNLSIKATYADHGDLAPQAVGYILETEGIRIYHTGDTCFCPDRILPGLDLPIDIMTAPINGQYGNMNAREACELGNLVRPAVLIANHFWMFLEHVGENGSGDPATFLEIAEQMGMFGVARVMAPGEVLFYNT